ncbi:hypothetical protein XENTR_v10015856 [Xenopus tropicalis]|nr:hypothetical protein XENTR_v10015856 [Xenopus tropicalis]
MLQLAILFYLFSIIFQHIFKNNKCTICKNVKSKKRTQKNQKSFERPSCGSAMGPKRLFIFLMLMVIGLLPCCETTSAIKHVTLFQHKLTFTAHTRNLIPCMFYPEHPINPAVLRLEWGKVPEDGGKYTPLIHLYSDRVETFPENSDKYQLFVSLVPSGNCSLIIDPTETTDSGTYEFWMSLNDKVYKPAAKIRIEVLEEKKTSQSRSIVQKKGKKEEMTTKTAPTTTTTVKTSTKPPTTSSSDPSKAAFISLMVIGPILIIGTTLSGVFLYCKLKRKMESGDVENPKVSTPAAQSQR